MLENVLDVGKHVTTPLVFSAVVLDNRMVIEDGNMTLDSALLVIEDGNITPDSPWSAAGSPRSLITDQSFSPNVDILMALLMMQHDPATDRSIPLTFKRASEYKPSWKEVNNFEKNVFNIHRK